MNKKNLFVVAGTILTATIGIATQNQSIGQNSSSLQQVLNNKDANLNIRFIDSFQVMGNCKSGQEASQVLEKKRDKLTREIQELEAARAQAVNDFKVKGATLSDAAREKAEKEARKLETDYQNKLQESEYEMKVAMQKATEQLAKEIEEVATAIALEDKLDAVVDIMTGRVIYASDKVVFTKKLINEMDHKREIKLAQAKNNKQDTVKVAAKKDASGPAA